MIECVQNDKNRYLALLLARQGFNCVLNSVSYDFGSQKSKIPTKVPYLELATLLDRDSGSL